MTFIINKPNFFVIGAPKSGTTFLYQYLQKHPDVLFSKIKEPHFFNTDFSAGKLHRPNSLDEYLKENFSHHKKFNCVGEGSTTYLLSKVAVKNILDFNPEAKFIILLRNPVDMCYSLHSEIYPEIEREKDFCKAWKLQDERMKGKMLPKNCIYPNLLQYREICSIGTKTEEVLETTKNSLNQNVMIVNFDSLIKNTKHVQKKLCEFINVNYKDIDVSPQKHAGYPRSIFLYKSLKKINEHASFIKKFGIPGKNILNTIHNFNTRFKKRPTLNPVFRKELEKAFAIENEKIKSLSQI